MNTSMKEALAKAGVALTPEEEVKEQEQRDLKHRSKTVIERPKTEFTLKSVTLEPFERKKYQSDPTDSLLEIEGGLTEDSFATIFCAYECAKEGTAAPYALVWCANTMQTWVAVDKLCLDQNFIYREDLEIIKPDGIDAAWSFYKERGGAVNPGISTRKTCYILDSPADEHYEVYYDSNYPALKYGKTTPNGMFVHKCKDRFHRDMKIMELDKMYQEESQQRATKLTKKELSANEAIVVSDGCFMKNVCASSYYYLDATSLIKMTQGIIPTEPDQAVLISEIAGATSALQMCLLKHKKKITYYYDNTSILNVLRNRKTEYIEEIVEYKKLLETLDNAGYQVTFIELHPKTGEERDTTNKALMFFHNYCDKECQDMARVFGKDYRSIAIGDGSEGKTYQQVKKEFAPKGRPGQSNGNKGVTNNQRNGNNRYGKKF